MFLQDFMLLLFPISSGKFLKSFIFPKDLCLDPGVFRFLVGTPEAEKQPLQNHHLDLLPK